MSAEFDEQWLAEYYRKRGKTPTGGRAEPKAPEPPKPAKPAKYRNVKTTVDGTTYDSKHEAAMHEELELTRKAGEIRALLTQVPFELPGGVVYKADFVTLNNDGTYTVLDAKSPATRKDKAYRIKRRLMMNCLGIEIKEI